MYYQSTISVGSEKTFFSTNYTIHLKFLAGGGLSGFLESSAHGLTFQSTLKGLYLEQEEDILVSFFIESTNPNLEDYCISSFSGKLLNYSMTCYCLVLQSLAVTEHVAKTVSMNSALEFLFDCPMRDPFTETKKVLLSCYDLSII